jgi:hypothetical protein
MRLFETPYKIQTLEWKRYWLGRSRRKAPQGRVAAPSFAWWHTLKCYPPALFHRWNLPVWKRGIASAKGRSAAAIIGDGSGWVNRDGGRERVIWGGDSSEKRRQGERESRFLVD